MATTTSSPPTAAGPASSIYGSNNDIFAGGGGGGSIVVNILEGTNNRADFNKVGGCCAVNFLHGTLDVKIASCGLRGSAVNGAPAIEGRYSLP